MSYSFNVVADTKDDAAKRVDAQLDYVVIVQPVHLQDRQLAQDAAEAAINKLVDPAAGECVGVSVSGSLTWRAEGEFTGVSLTVCAAISQKPAAPVAAEAAA